MTTTTIRTRGTFACWFSTVWWGTVTLFGATFVGAALANAAQSGTDHDRTVLDGVFSEGQAGRGERIYATRCARCHDGADVDGPALTGDRFIDRWREDSLQTLFTFIRTRMPGDEPGTLDAPAYIDVLAYMLAINDAPPGSRELTPDALPRTLLVGPRGPQPLPANALVEVVGCLMKDGEQGWMLTGAARPSRVRNATQISEADADAAGGRTPGATTMALLNLPELGATFAPDANAGRRVVVRGAFNRTSAAGSRASSSGVATSGPAGTATTSATTDRVRVLAARPVAGTCEP